MRKHPNHIKQKATEDKKKKKKKKKANKNKRSNNDKTKGKKRFTLEINPRTTTKRPSFCNT